MALVGGARTAGAEDDTVRVTCSALTPEDAAQVEARTRATLLTTEDAHLSVRIDCVANQATVRVAAGERAESTVVTLSDENARDALLAAVERTLEALERSGEPGSAAPPPAPTPGAVAATGTQPKTEAAPEAAPAPAPQPAPDRGTPPPDRSARPFEVGAGALAELWDGAFGLGARLAAERRLSPWSVGAALGWLTAPGLGEPFRADEFHAFAYGTLEERTTGLCGSLGAGISALGVSPDPEVVAQSSTTLTLVMFELGLSRPIRFGRASLLPAVDLRLLPARREVNVDARQRLALPPLCPSLFLGFGYAI